MVPLENAPNEASAITYAWQPSLPEEFSPRATTINNWKRSDGAFARHVPNPLPAGISPQVGALLGAHGWPLAAWTAAPPRRSAEDVVGSSAADTAADRLRIRKASVFHWKKRADLVPDGDEQPATDARSASAGSPKAHRGNPQRSQSGRGKTGSAGAPKEASRPHSAPLLVSRRDKTADKKAVVGRAGERSWRQPAALLASSRCEAAMECLAGEIEGPATRDEHRKLEKLGLLGAGGTLRENLEADLREQDRVEMLHRKLRRMQADVEERDVQIAMTDAAIREQGRKAKGLELTAKHLQGELMKPSESERRAVAERDEALERARRREERAAAKSAKILEQSRRIQRLEVEVKQLRQQLEARPVAAPKRALKKIHRPLELKLKPRKKLDDLTIARTMGLLNILPEYSPRAAMEAVERTREERKGETNTAKVAGHCAAIPLEVSDA